jgi:hypothetical protein
VTRPKLQSTFYPGLLEASQRHSGFRPLMMKPEAKYHQSTYLQRVSNAVKSTNAGTKKAK